MDDIVENVVATVGVDEDQVLNAGPGNVGEHVADDGGERRRADGNGPRERCMLVRARERDWGQEGQIVRRSKGLRDGAGNHRIGDQGQVRTVLLEAAYRENGNVGVAICLLG